MIAGSTQFDTGTFRRLLVQVAVAAGYLLRVEHRARSGRVTTRIVRPVGYLAPETGGPGSMVTRLADRTESTFSLDDIDHLSIASEHLPVERVTRDGWRVGDPVRHADFGFGVIQSFPSDDVLRAVARFASSGETALSLRTAPLSRTRPTDTGSSSDWSAPLVQPRG